MKDKNFQISATYRTIIRSDEGHSLSFETVFSKKSCRWGDAGWRKGVGASNIDVLTRCRTDRLRRGAKKRWNMAEKGYGHEGNLRHEPHMMSTRGFFFV